MSSLLLFYSVILGAIIGSFLNVVIFRFHTGRSIGGRSSCATCAHRLKWFDLIPIVSFVILGGKCRSCHSRISWQYPLIELLTAAVFFCITANFLENPNTIAEWTVLGFSLVVWPLLIVILGYDLRHKIIPDALVYTVALGTLLFRLIMIAFAGEGGSWIDLLAGPIFFIPFFLLWFLSNGRWMGLGDGKLSLGIGWLLGMYGGISALVFGFWAGAIVGLFLVAITSVQSRLKRGSKAVTMKSELPFAPFLIAGMCAVQFFNFSLFAGL